MSNDLKCPICGEPTSVWYGNARKDRLCRYHAQLYKEGSIIQCENCGKWHNADEDCTCTRNIEKSVETYINSPKLSCLICGKESNGKHFCKECYNKYKSKVLLIKISNCEKSELQDESYEGIYICDDGHIVKSKDEREIDDYLYNKNIQHAYEKALDIDDKEEHDLHPDFYIPNYNGISEIYIEHWGMDTEKYNSIKNYKHEIYKKLCKERGITVIYTYAHDMKDPKTALTRKLRNIKEKQIND